MKSVRAIKDVVSQNQRDGVLADERFGDEKRLGDSLGLGLLAVLDAQPPRAAVAEQLAEAGQIVGRGNQAELPDTAFDEGRQRIIDHRLVENRLELFARDQRKRKQAGASTPGQ